MAVLAAGTGACASTSSRADTGSTGARTASGRARRRAVRHQPHDGDAGRSPPGPTEAGTKTPEHPGRTLVTDVYVPRRRWALPPHRVRPRRRRPPRQGHRAPHGLGHRRLRGRRPCLPAHQRHGGRSAATTGGTWPPSQATCPSCSTPCSAPEATATVWPRSTVRLDGQLGDRRHDQGGGSVTQRIDPDRIGVGRPLAGRCHHLRRGVQHRAAGTTGSRPPRSCRGRSCPSACRPVGDVPARRPRPPADRARRRTTAPCRVPPAAPRSTPPLDPPVWFVTLIGGTHSPPYENDPSPWDGR